MIRIKSQDAVHQYDESGTAITTWCEKRCNWIVNKEFEDADIDWYGEDSDYPAGVTAAQHEENNPEWRTYPNISMKYTCNNVRSYSKATNMIPEIMEKRYGSTVYPVNWTRSWGYYPRVEISSINEAILRFWSYCDWGKNADSVSITYDDETMELKRDGVMLFELANLLPLINTTAK